jgi:hypothetical protein
MGGTGEAGLRQHVAQEAWIYANSLVVTGLQQCQSEHLFLVGEAMDLRFERAI